MSTGPILPKTFAGYLHPLNSKYTNGSDNKRGLGANEVKQLKTDIALSKVLNKDEKVQANTIADKARTMTQAALKDGNVSDTELQSMLKLAQHDTNLQPLKQGNAAAEISFAGETLDHSKLKTEFFKVAAGTSYAPINNKMEGGTKDSIGKPLGPHTLDKYVAAMKAGNAKSNEYVAVALDSALYKGSKAPMKYGDVFRIPEIEKIKGVSPIYFAVVDNGGAFKGTSGAKIDICCDKSETYDVQQSLSLHKVMLPDGDQLNIEDMD